MTGAELLSWVAGWVWGALLGVFYFGGLYWTLRRLAAKGRPKIFLGLSYLVRVGVALGGFWLVLRRDFIVFLIALVGFFLARFAVTRHVYSSLKKVRDADQS